MTHPVADDAVSDERSAERATSLASDEPATDGAAGGPMTRPTRSDPTVGGRPGAGGLSGERTLFALLLVGAAFVRLVGPGQLEPNVSTAEVSHLGAIEALLAGQDTSLLGRPTSAPPVLALLRPRSCA